MTLNLFLFVFVGVGNQSFRLKRRLSHIPFILSVYCTENNILSKHVDHAVVWIFKVHCYFLGSLVLLGK